MDFLFAEEAESFWARQELLWRQEETARAKLIGDVVGSWREQINNKIRAAGNRVREISEEREQLQNDIEALNREIDLKDLAKEEQRVRFADDLDTQIERRDEILKDVEESEHRQQLVEKFDQWKLDEVEIRETDITVSS